MSGTAINLGLLAALAVTLPACARAWRTPHTIPGTTVPLTTIRIVDLDGHTWGHVRHTNPAAAWAMAADILTTHPRWLAEPDHPTWNPS